MNYWIATIWRECSFLQENQFSQTKVNKMKDKRIDYSLNSLFLVTMLKVVSKSIKCHLNNQLLITIKIILWPIENLGSKQATLNRLVEVIYFELKVLGSDNWSY